MLLLDIMVFSRVRGEDELQGVPTQAVFHEGKTASFTFVPKEEHRRRIDEAETTGRFVLHVTGLFSDSPEQKWGLTEFLHDWKVVRPALGKFLGLSSDTCIDQI
jgi:hypothetical protein